MRALKLPVQVTRDHTLRLELPQDVSEGPAEVIVLIPDSGEDIPGQPVAGDLEDFLSGPRVDRRFILDKKAIDDFVQEERDSWE